MSLSREQRAAKIAEVEKELALLSPLLGKVQAEHTISVWGDGLTKVTTRVKLKPPASGDRGELLEVS